MDLSIVATASSVLGTALNAMKYVREVSDSTDDLELKSRINTLYDAILDVKQYVIERDEENRRLKAELDRKDEFIGPVEPHGYFFRSDKQDQPLCPRCFQKQPSHPAFLSPLTNLDGGQYRSCLQCGYDNYETPRKYSSDPVMSSRSSLFHQSRGYL